MAEEQEIVKTVIRQQSVFKVKDFYSFFYDLVTSNGFDVFEVEFKRDPELTSFEWNCLKWVDDYVQYKIWVKCKITNAKSVKVKRGEITESMEKANVEMKIKGRFITDWKMRWETKPVIKLLKGFYDKFLFKPTIDSRKAELTNFVHLFENEVKSYFELPRFM